MIRIALRVSLISFALGCLTAPIEQRASVSVPSGLNANDVEVAVLYELANQNVPTALTPGERIANNAMNALFTFGYRPVSSREPGWYPESAEPGIIFAGYEKGQHYLRVAIEYNDSTVRTRIVESRNLRQSEVRIHKAAGAWMDELEMRIRRALGQMAAMRTLQGREPN